MMYFYYKICEYKTQLENNASISMDRSLHINLDDAPLAHRTLDGVLITSNMRRIRSLVALSASVWL